MAGAIKAVGIAVSIIAYPFLSPYLIRHGFAGAELSLFAGLCLWRGLKVDSLGFRVGYLALAALFFAGAFFAQAYLVWLIPSFVYLSLALLFGHTLWSPPSLCERLVRLQFPEFKPGIAEYLRQLTWVWTAFFAINVPLCALLPVVAGAQAWSVYTGVVVYLLMGLLGVGEYLYRPRRFPDLGIPPLLETFTAIARDGHKIFHGIKP